MEGGILGHMKKLIVANWKMYLTLCESVALAKKVAKEASRLGSASEAHSPQARKNNMDIVVCPSFVALEEVAKVLKRTKIKLGAQDVEPARRGAYTGEVGLDDLTSLHVQYVLVGHSERRRKFGETDIVVNKKLRAVLASGMRPILCIGEPLTVRKRGGQMRYVGAQLKAGLRGVSKKDLQRVAVAYEPIWAISGNGGREDTPEDASEMHRWIRKVIHGGKASGAPEALPHVLYGGSVNAKNASSFLKAKGIDGLLIGRASTKATEFSRILKCG